MKTATFFRPYECKNQSGVEKIFTKFETEQFYKLCQKFVTQNRTSKTGSLYENLNSFLSSKIYNGNSYVGSPEPGIPQPVTKTKISNYAELKTICVPFTISSFAVRYLQKTNKKNHKRGDNVRSVVAYSVSITLFSALNIICIHQPKNILETLM